MPRFPAPCCGCSVRAPAEPVGISTGSPSSSDSDVSSSGSDTKPQQEPRTFNFRAAALAVRASNRLAVRAGSGGGGKPFDSSGCGAEEEELGSGGDGNHTATRTSLVKQLRQRTRRLTMKRITQTLGTSKDDQLRDLMDFLEPGMPLGGLSDFAKAYGDEAFCGRLLRKYPNNVPKCAEKLKQALVWREQNKVLLTTRRCPQAGDYRVIGADLAERPVLYMCMRNQLLPLGQCVDFMVVAMLRAVDNMPAGVETATHIWDLHGMMIRLNWNPAPLVAILKMAEGYFAERMHQVTIVDMPRMAAFLKDAVWPLLPEKTQEKVKFMTAEEAQTYVGQHCPADVAGRVRGSMQQNRDSSISLEERKRSWMCVNERGELAPALA